MSVADFMALVRRNGLPDKDQTRIDEGIYQISEPVKGQTDIPFAAVSPYNVVNGGETVFSGSIAPQTNQRPDGSIDYWVNPPRYVNLATRTSYKPGPAHPIGQHGSVWYSRKVQVNEALVPDKESGLGAGVLIPIGAAVFLGIAIAIGNSS